jgi:tetratricopeptide (TPR) repeat protein
MAFAASEPMNADLPSNSPLALEAMDSPVAGGDRARQSGEQPPAGPGIQRELGITMADEFLAAAAKEYQEGHIDAALWSRVSGKPGHDPSLVAAAYLRARAATLRREKRAEKAATGADSADSARGATPSKAGRELRESDSTGVGGAPTRTSMPNLKYLLAAGALAIAVVGVLIVAALRENDSAGQPGLPVATVTPDRPVPPVPSANGPSLAPSANGSMSQEIPQPTLEARVQQLKSAGNWNVLVLYASEWTRKEPNNAAAWKDLSIGYANLRQFEDALDAATKATQLAPNDPLLWRNLGRINLAVDLLPEAGVAFARGLTLNPDDADALCGSLTVAQKQGRQQDADAMALRLKALDAVCPGATVAESVAVAAGPSPARKTARPGGR